MILVDSTEIVSQFFLTLVSKNLLVETIDDPALPTPTQMVKIMASGPVQVDFKSVIFQPLQSADPSVAGCLSNVGFRTTKTSSSMPGLGCPRIVSYFMR